MSPRLDELLRAAGDPTRLRILELLRDGGRCVCEIQAALGSPQATVSRHLGTLRHAGLVEHQRRGARIFYSLVPPVSPRLRALYRLVDTAAPGEAEPPERRGSTRRRA